MSTTTITVKDYKIFSILTNLIYGVIGIIAGVMHGWEGFLLASALVYLMVGSGIYHLYTRHDMVWADWSAMYFVFSMFIFTFLNEFELFNNWILSGGIILASLLSYFHSKLEKINVFGISFMYFLVGMLYSATLILSFFVLPFWAFATSGILFAVAFYIRQVGQAKLDIKPKLARHAEIHNIFHGIWHLLTGIGMFLYLFY
jgi:hypothetical protein